MAKYKVIWFDDKHDTLNLIREKAFLTDIELIGFGNAKEGIEEMEKNIKNYDAAVIDGLFYATPDETGTPTSDLPLFQVAIALLRLAPIKILPWFILSGQVGFTKEKNRFADAFKNNQVYDKLNSEQLDKLWQDIKFEADKQIETQIRHKYQRAFEVCNETYIGNDAAKSLLLLLESVEKIDGSYNTEEKLNAVRKIIEKLFKKFSQIGVLPNDVRLGTGGINNSSKFLAGVHPSYSYTEEILPPALSFILKNVLHLTQDGSHGEGDLNLKVDFFIKSQPTGYLFNNIIFQLLEILVWSRYYFDSKLDYVKNSTIATLKPPENVTIIEDIIQLDRNRNYHCRDIILTYTHFTERGYSVGDRIRVLRFIPNTNEKTMHFYSKSAIITEKI